VDLYNVACYGVNGQTGDQLISLVKQAMEKNGLLVFVSRSGGEHSLNVSLQAHSHSCIFQTIKGYLDRPDD
jgi:hypothetical protein